ncbi:unnamed protein product [Heligmosomoides polygyrus]|uniref:Bestrophin homolog n=1 Tax=Heligmosomoides polygyrus TaxID=6339 RepID=A0A3P7V6P0_HELPZ|nr:unnamed protein product [Heligmosomoides polygyrus]
MKTFERIADYCDYRLVYIPLTFMLGFFVSIIVDRWRSIFNNMGWIENLALTVAHLLRGEEKEPRQMRRDIVRYTVLAQVSDVGTLRSVQRFDRALQILVFRDISLRVRRRFPNMDTLVAAGKCIDAVGRKVFVTKSFSAG